MALEKKGEELGREGFCGGLVLHQNKPSGSHCTTSFQEIIRDITELAHEYINRVSNTLQVDTF